MTLNISKSEHNRDGKTNTASPWVEDVQTSLIKRGYSCGKAGADGDFGSATEYAVKRFQSKNGLTSDGIVGPKTWSKLHPAAALASAATRMADIAYDLVTGKTDGSRPQYVYGAECKLTDPSPDRLDCSELVQWAVYQAIKDDWRDGSANQAGACRMISVSEASRTKGALLFISSNGHVSGVHHVAISMGNGTTAEARSTASGCGSWSASGRGFSFGGLIPVLNY